MKDGYKVKICGTTSVEDALLAGHEGADFVGVVVETEFSKRSLSIERAAEIFYASPLPTVALVYQMKEERIHYLIEKLKPYAIQFLSQEDYDVVRRLKSAYPNIYLWQSIHLPCAGNEFDLEKVKGTVEGYMQAGIDMLLYDTAAVVEGVKKFGGT
ncbi:MAG: phosphoribosylanthranilate isomerase, partial [Clostridiaceae bacterium]|nr:phosphoribosylanthranilate isomerase [Clostridiaceae bacterium]